MTDFTRQGVIKRKKKKKKRKKDKPHFPNMIGRLYQFERISTKSTRTSFQLCCSIYIQFNAGVM